MQIRIRLMEEEDIPIVAAIIQKEVYDELTQDEMEDWLRKSAEPPYLECFVAKKPGGEIVGFISWGLSDMYNKQIILEIEMIAVEKESQRKGVGSQLLRKTFQRVRNIWKKGELDIVTVRVETDGDNRIAQNFFSKVLSMLGSLRVTTTPMVWSVTPSGERDLIQYFVRFFF